MRPNLPSDSQPAHGIANHFLVLALRFLQRSITIPKPLGEFYWSSLPGIPGTALCRPIQLPGYRLAAPKKSLSLLFDARQQFFVVVCEGFHAIVFKLLGYGVQVNPDA